MSKIPEKVDICLNLASLDTNGPIVHARRIRGSPKDRSTHGRIWTTDRE